MSGAFRSNLLVEEFCATEGFGEGFGAVRDLVPPSLPHCNKLVLTTIIVSLETCIQPARRQHTSHRKECKKRVAPYTLRTAAPWLVPIISDRFLQLRDDCNTTSQRSFALKELAMTLASQVVQVGPPEQIVLMVRLEPLVLLGQEHQRLQADPGSAMKLFRRNSFLF